MDPQNYPAPSGSNPQQNGQASQSGRAGRPSGDEPESGQQSAQSRSHFFEEGFENPYMQSRQVTYGQVSEQPQQQSYSQPSPYGAAPQPQAPQPAQPAAQSGQYGYGQQSATQYAGYQNYQHYGQAAVQSQLPGSYGQPTPNGTPQYPSPVYPQAAGYQQYQQHYGSPHAYQQQAPPPQKSRLSSMLGPLAALTAFMVILLGIVGYLVYNGRTTPETVYTKFLQAVHGTSQVKQVSSTPETATATILYDVSQVTNPTVSIKTDVKLGGEFFQLNLETEGYGTLTDSYLKYNKMDDATPTEIPYLNKWIQVRKNGTLTGETDEATSAMSEAYFNVFGNFIFGNFNAADKQVLSELLRASYTFDPKKVTKDRVDNQPVYVYDLTPQFDKLEAYNVKAAEIMGANKDEVTEFVRQMERTETVSHKLHVLIQNGHPVKVISGDQDQEVTTIYSDFNNLSLPSAPAPVMDLKQLYDLMTSTNSDGSITL